MEVSCSAALALAWERELSSREAAVALLGACVAIVSSFQVHALALTILAAFSIYLSDIVNMFT